MITDFGKWIKTSFKLNNNKHFQNLFLSNSSWIAFLSC